VSGQDRQPRRFETERLLVRPVMPCDRDLLHALEQDPDVMRYLNGGLPTPLVPPAEDRGYLMPRGTEAEIHAVRLRGDNAFIGWVAFFPEDQTAELGYRFAKSAWGKGYAVESCVPLLDHAFNVLGLEAVSACTMTVNRGSRRVMEKLGMTCRQTVHPHFSDPIDGMELGEVIYSVTRDEWKPAA
jgi:RimJ/RimL family protein N-acetyltransferase